MYFLFHLIFVKKKTPQNSKNKKPEMSRRMDTNTLMVVILAWRENGWFRCSFCCLSKSSLIHVDWFCDNMFSDVLPKQSQRVKIVLALMILKMWLRRTAVATSALNLLPTKTKWYGERVKQHRCPGESRTLIDRDSLPHPGPQSERTRCTWPCKAISHKRQRQRCS